jgi:Flp pilus assembly protein TadG
MGGSRTRRSDGYDWRGERGQALVLVVVMLPLFLSIIGLAIDGGMALNQRRLLQNVADGAARAGAMQLDEQAYRQTSGSAVVLDTGAARAAAVEYLSGRAVEVSATIEVDSRRVVVQASREVPTGFLRLIGLRAVQISATAPAEVRHGIERGIR